MPEIVAKSVSEGVYALHACTAGVRVKFVTDSSYIAINVKMDTVRKMPHFAFSGSIGFDLYVDDDYTKTFVPPVDITEGYEGIFEFETKEKRNITINFPLYADVQELYVGLQKDSYLSQSAPYKNTKPII